MMGLWRKVSLTYWLTLLCSFFVWLIGWALRLYPWVPTLETIAVIVGLALIVETVALLNKEAGDTLSEVARWLGRLKAMIPLAFGIVGGAGLTIGVFSLEGVTFRLLIVQVATIVTVLGVLLGHFFIPPTDVTRKKATMQTALIFGMIHGVGSVFASAFPGGGMLLFVVAASALYLGSIYFLLND